MNEIEFIKTNQIEESVLVILYRNGEVHAQIDCY
jgi:hypothetical protein